MKGWTEADIKKLEDKGMVTIKKVAEPVELKKKIKIPASTPEGKKFIGEFLFVLYVTNVNNFEIIQELKFHPTRKWRFDYCIKGFNKNGIEFKIAIEYEGLFSEKSRHTTLNGFTRDCEKYNAAQILGWMVFRYTAINYKDVVNDINQLL